MLTLMPNQPDASHGRLKRLLIDWDARMNRSILGPKWQTRTEKRLRWIAFPEKIDTNPHWHLLLNLTKRHRGWFERDVTQLEDLVQRHWKALVSSGTTDTQEIYDDGAVRYCTKLASVPRDFTNFELSEGLCL